MFKPDPNHSYMMPAHFGPRYTGPGTSGWYNDVTAVVVPYRTDSERLSALLPAPLKVGSDALISVSYVRNQNVDWLAGRGYNLIGVHADVIFEGEEDRLEGNYCLAMWENLADPILTGREVQGVPKIFADIPDHEIKDGFWCCEASHYGNRILELTVGNTFPASAEDIAAYQESTKDRDHSIGWRYLPAVGGYGEGRSEFTTFPSESEHHSVLVGEAHIEWQHLTWEQNPTQFHIVNALADLPVIEYLPGIITQGKTNLMVGDRPTRVLR